MSEQPRQIFSVHGMMPEPLGYSLAKFSRSAKEYTEWAKDLTNEGAEKFYDTNYFAYGHASIADLAHVAIVAEGISQVAAFQMWLPLIDGQESSTRYQTWSRRNIFTPPELQKTDLGDDLVVTSLEMIRAYNEMKEPVVRRFRETKNPPSDMDKDIVEKTFNARSFDITRYLLPNSVTTGLGQIMSARTAERLLSSLLASPLQEVREIAGEMKNAFTKNSPYNPNEDRVKEALKDYPGVYEKVSALLSFGKPVAPTVIKHAEARKYDLLTYPEFEREGKELFAYGPILPAKRGPELFTFVSPEIDFLSSLFYRTSRMSYGEIKYKLERFNESEKRKLLDLANKHRTKYDPLPDEAATNVLIYDLCLDIGASRDLNRHRNLVKIVQQPNPYLGWSIPRPTNDKDMLVEIGWQNEFAGRMRESFKLAERIYETAPAVAAYTLPMAANRRMLLKMDPKQLEYMTNDRTSVQGHFSYREIVYDMYKKFEKIWPDHASSFRVTDPSEENFFKR